MVFTVEIFKKGSDSVFLRPLGSEPVMLIYSARGSEQFHCDTALTLLIMMLLLLYLDWCSTADLSLPPSKTQNYSGVPAGRQRRAVYPGDLSQLAMTS